MRKIVQNWLAAILFVASIGGTTLSVVLPQTSLAACNDRLLTFPAWYKGLTDDKCDIKNPGNMPGGIQSFIWTIVLNVVEFMLQLVGYLAVGFIIYGGFKYMTSAGSADGMTKSKNIIMNAIVGLIISIFSVAIVNVVAGAIK
jgi:hypothetical protein